MDQILDFETTSDGGDNDFPFEIIQFGVVVFDVKANQVRSDLSFNTFVRPVLNPHLTVHCSNFTGIKQQSLDIADTFPTVYDQFLEWLRSNNFVERQFAIVCDGRQDMWRIAQYQFKLVNIILPAFFRQYINLWRVFQIEQNKRGRKVLTEGTNIEKMAEYYKLNAVGRAHDSFNDSKTLAYIAKAMLETGATVTINEVLTCFAICRKKPLVLEGNWRTNFRAACLVYERILPLVVISVQAGKYKQSDYGNCKYCKSGPEKCGKRHRQYPIKFYKSENTVVVFARVAGYD